MNQSEQHEYGEFLRHRREYLVDRIAAAATRAGRDAREVLLLAVSKTVDVPQIIEAYKQGYTAFGENRPQDLCRKADALQQFDDLRIDMIGNLQTNKINKVLGRAALVHSVATIHLAEALSTRAQARGVRVRCLLEVNVSGEGSKAGIAPCDAARTVERISQLDKLDLEGFMTMAPAHNDSEARRTFCGLRNLRDEVRESVGLELPVLSCGMSDDFEIAVEEGSTLVRLGRIVFDPSYDVDGHMQ